MGLDFTPFLLGVRCEREVDLTRGKNLSFLGGSRGIDPTRRKSFDPNQFHNGA
jgi:hypothetical protein